MKNKIIITLAGVLIFTSGFYTNNYIDNSRSEGCFDNDNMMKKECYNQITDEINKVLTDNMELKDQLFEYYSENKNLRFQNEDLEIRNKGISNLFDKFFHECLIEKHKGE